MANSEKLDKYTRLINSFNTASDKLEKKNKEIEGDVNGLTYGQMASMFESLDKDSLLKECVAHCNKANRTNDAKIASSAEQFKDCYGVEVYYTKDGDEYYADYLVTTPKALQEEYSRAAYEMGEGKLDDFSQPFFNDKGFEEYMVREYPQVLIPELKNYETVEENENIIIMEMQ